MTLLWFRFGDQLIAFDAQDNGLHLKRPKSRWTCRLSALNATRLHYELQADIPSAYRKVRVERRCARPYARPGGAVVEHLGAERSDERDVDRRHDQAFNNGAQLAHSIRAIRRRRTVSSSQPPIKNNSPSPTRLAERPSLSITFEK